MCNINAIWSQIRRQGGDTGQERASTGAAGNSGQAAENFYLVTFFIKYYKNNCFFFFADLTLLVAPAALA
jgi:hypothetical protein